MRALRRFSVIALIVVFFAVRFVVAGELPTAKPGEVGLDGDKIQQAHDAVKALIDKKEMAGAVIAVARKGKVVMFEAQGEMEAGSGEPMKTDTIVRIYIRVGQDDSVAGRFVDEYAWGGAASTHFWIAPKQELVVVALEQFMPNRPMLKDAIKPLFYQAVKP
jgi:CubicO group peptidase (beta-lactamase class C family)